MIICLRQMKMKRGDEEMQEYIIALQGISYSDWVKLKAGIDRTFEMQKREFEKNLKLANTDHVKKIIHSQFE